MEPNDNSDRFIHTNSPEVQETCRKVFDHLNKLSSEEFRELLEKHRDGDIAKMFEEIFDYSNLLQKDAKCNSTKHTGRGNSQKL